MRRSMWATRLLLLGALASVVAGQLWLRHGVTAVAIAMWLGGLALVVWLQWPTMPEAPVPAEPADLARLSTPQLALLATTASAFVATVALGWRRDPSSDHTLVAFAWVVGMVALLLAAAWPRAGWRAAFRRQRPGRWSRPERVAFVTIVGVAGLLRCYRLDRWPWAVDGDAGAFMLLARDVLDGRLRDPFSTGFSDQATLFAYIQAGSCRLLGTGLVGLTMPSAVAGTAAVAMTYLLARRLLGVPSALVAATALAAFHVHLFFSRVALNNAFDGLWAVAMLYAVDRAFVDGRRLAAASAGLVVGLSLYFYVGARLLPLVALAYVAFLAVQQRRRVAWTTVLRLAGWVVAGAVLAFAPLAMHFAVEPWDLTSRQRQVQLSRAWLEAERERTGAGTATVLARQARDAALLPFATPSQGNYHPPVPLLGWLAVPAALGAAVATAGARRRRHAGSVLLWWGSLAGVGLTIGHFSQRWSVALPVVAIFFAVGVDAVWRVASATLAPGLVPRRALAGVFAAVVVTLSAASASAFFRDEPLRAYSDVNTLVASELGRELQHEPAGTAVVMLAAPRMSFRSHPPLQVLAPQVTGIDVVTPLTSPAQVPTPAARTVFVALPERSSEMALVRSRFPGGVDATVRWRDGQVLYETYRVDASP